MRDVWPVVAVAAVVILAIVGLVVADARPVVGTVMERQFYPAHYETGTRTQCVPQPEGKTICYPVSYTEWKQDAWWLRACQPVKEGYPKGWGCRWRQVSEGLYRRVQVGEWYDEREQGR